MSTLIDFLNRLPAADPRPDDALLAAFRAGQEAAFARLVHRHGPLVWGVCRRLLRRPADAEDAFQATFLAAVRHLDRLSGPLGPWLHTVATRTALALRKRLAKDAPTAPLDGLATPAPAESPIDIDSLLLALPEKYREAVVLCYLSGHTQAEAAGVLGCPEGTLSARLSRGLAMLRERAAADPKVLLAAAMLALPAALSAATARLGVAVKASLAAAPAHLLALTEGAMPMRHWMMKLVAGVAILALVGTGAVFAWPRPTPEVRGAFAPVPKEMPPKNGLLALWGKGRPVLLRPDGTHYRDLWHDDYDAAEGCVAVSPDGKRVAVLAQQSAEALGGPYFVTIHKLYIRGIDEKGPGVLMPSEGLTFRGRLVWSPDGKRLYGDAGPTPAEMRKAVAAGKAPPFGRDRAVVFDVATRKRSDVPVPAGEHLLGERPDGRLLVTSSPMAAKGGGWVFRWSWLSPDGKESSPFDLGADQRMTANDHLSADGRRLLSVLGDPEARHGRLMVSDLVTKKQTVLPLAGLPAKDFVIERARWSPDGKKIAFYHLPVTEVPGEPWWRWPRGGAATLCVCDADGKNLKVVLKTKAERLHYFEWK